jgi:hypothetical protein
LAADADPILDGAAAWLCTRYKCREPVSITIVPAGSFVGFCTIAAVF